MLGGGICLSVYLMGLSVLDYCHVSMKIPTSKLMWFQKWKGLSILGRLLGGGGFGDG